MSSAHHYRGSTLVNGERYIKRDGDDVIKVSPLLLDIIWGGNSRYWRIDKIRGIAELAQVSWLEVNGSLGMAFLEPRTRYKLEFEVSLNPDAFGWNDSPVYVMVKPGSKANYIWKSADLTKIKDDPRGCCTIPFPWSSLVFTVPPSDGSNDKLFFGLFEIWKGGWKGGLVIRNVIITKVD